MLEVTTFFEIATLIESALGGESEFVKERDGVLIKSEDYYKLQELKKAILKRVGVQSEKFNKVVTDAYTGSKGFDSPLKAEIGGEYRKLSFSELPERRNNKINPIIENIGLAKELISLANAFDKTEHRVEFVPLPIRRSVTGLCDRIEMDIRELVRNGQPEQ